MDDQEQINRYVEFLETNFHKEILEKASKGEESLTIFFF